MRAGHELQSLPWKGSLLGGLAYSCSQAGPTATPVPQGRQEVSSRVFSSFPQLKRDISHTNPVHGVEGEGIVMLLLSFFALGLRGG